MKKITYSNSQNSGALSAEDWVLLVRLLKFITSDQDKGGAGQAITIRFHFAPSTTEAILEFTDSEQKDLLSITDLLNQNS